MQSTPNADSSSSCTKIPKTDIMKEVTPLKPKHAVSGGWGNMFAMEWKYLGNE